MSKGIPGVSKSVLAEIPPIWKTYLYHLQQQAPTPKRIICPYELPYRPSHYGREFHGSVSREDAERLLQEEGSYLVRESQRAPGQFTLSMKFRGAVKNFKLYFDGKHYVGEKRFDTVQDLVADGLITLYLETHAGNYIAMMHQESTYAESPYMTLNPYRQKLWKMHQRTLKRSNKGQQAPSSQQQQQQQQQQQPQQPSQHQQQSSQPISSSGMPASTPINICRPQPTVLVQENLRSPHEYEVPPLEFTFDDDFDDEDIDVQQFEKPHNFKTSTFKGLTWCDFCGNFMWGLIAQGVKCEDCGLSAHHRCSEKIPNQCLPDLKYVKRIFGVDLTTLVKAHNTLRPFVVDHCIREIELRGLDAEGIYRVPGFNDTIEAIKLAFEKDGEKAEIGQKACEDINVIAGVLKLFFRLLPIPLITYDAYKYFIHACNHSRLENKLYELKEAVRKLPPAHYQTLKFLMAHLSKVTERSHVNLMTSHNLSTVFCPSILRSPELCPSEILASWHLESAVLELLITHHSNIFV